MSKTICVIGAFDTKGEDHAFLRQEILRLGCQVLTINIGVLGTTTLFPVDFEAKDVLKAGGTDLGGISAQGDKGAAMKTFDQAAPRLFRELYFRQIRWHHRYGRIRRFIHHCFSDALDPDRTTKSTGLDGGFRRCLLLRAGQRHHDDPIDR